MRISLSALGLVHVWHVDGERRIVAGRKLGHLLDRAGDQLAFEHIDTGARTGRTRVGLLELASSPCALGHLDAAVVAAVEHSAAPAPHDSDLVERRLLEQLAE